MNLERFVGILNSFILRLSGKKQQRQTQRILEYKFVKIVFILIKFN